MRIKRRELNQIIGGTNISGTIINAFSNIIKILSDVGKGVGSSIRRLVDNSVCPLE